MPFQVIGDPIDGQPTATQFHDAANRRITLIVFARLSGSPGIEGPLGFRAFDITGDINRGFTLVPRDPSTAWQLTPGIIRGNPAAVPLSSTAWRVYMRGIDDALWLLWSNGSETFGPSRITGPGADGVFDSEISPVHSLRRPGEFNLLHVFIRGTDGALWHYAQPPGFATMTDMNLESLGGFFSGNPAAVALPDDVLQIFVRGSDEALWRHILRGGTSLGWQRVGDGPMVGDPVPVVAREPRSGEHTICVFYLDSSFRVRYRSIKLRADDLMGLTGNAADDQELTGSPNGYPGAASRDGSDFYVFARDSTGAVRFANIGLAHIWGSFSAWSSLGVPGSPPPAPPTDIPPIIPTPPGGADVPVAVGRPTVIHCLVRGSDRRLYHSFSWGGPFS